MSANKPSSLSQLLLEMYFDSKNNTSSNVTSNNSGKKAASSSSSSSSSSSVALASTVGDDRDLIYCMGSRLIKESVLDINILPLYDTIIDIITSASTDSSNGHDVHHKIRCYRLIAIILQSNRISSSISSKLCALVDRLPTLLEFAQHYDEILALTDMFICFVDAIATDIHNRMQKSMSKIIGACVRMLSKDSSISNEISLNALTYLAQSKLHTTLCTNASSIMNACSPLLKHPILNEKAGILLSLLLSVESADGWTAAMQFYTIEMCQLVKLMDVKVAVDKSFKDINSTTLALLQKLNIVTAIDSKDLKQLQGITKAIVIDRVYRGYCCVLENMIKHGCVGNAVPIDMSLLLPLLSSILTTTMMCDASNSSKNVISNEASLSVIDISIVMPQLKIHSLLLLRALLQINGTSLLRISNSIIRILASLLTSTDCARISRLELLTYECLEFVASSFPTVLCKSGICVTVTDSLQLLMNIITTNPSAIDDNSNGTGRSSADMDIDSMISMFSLAERILLHGGGMLPQAVRDSFELIVGQGLCNLMKGIMTTQLSNRKVYKATCSVLRSTPTMQVAFMKLCTAEILSSSMNGLGSGNAPMLRIVGQALLHFHETANVAIKSLLIVDSILNPSAIVIPTVPAALSARKEIDRRATTRIAGNVLNDSILEIFPTIDAGVDSRNDNSIVSMDTEVDALRQQQEQQVQQQNEKKRKAESSTDSASFQPLHLPNTAKKITTPTASTTAATTVDVKGDDNSSDDELPDIIG